MVFKKYLVFIVCIFLLVSYGVQSTIAGKQTYITINTNFQKFFPVSQYPELLELYHSGILQFEIHSDIGNQRIIEKDGNLVFFSPNGIVDTQAELEISLGERSNIIPLRFINTQSETDFSIADDMYSLSLQGKSLSCESVASSDILSTIFGNTISEDAVIQELEKSLYYNRLPEKHPDGITIWGNPNQGFVGYIDHTEEIQAKQKLMTGYGVYEAPIARVYETYGLQTQILNGDSHNSGLSPDIHLRYLLEKLKRGAYIQLWGDWCTTPEYDDGILESKHDFEGRNIDISLNAKNTCYNIDDSRELHWKYYGKNGELVNHVGLDGEHAFILLGWKGSLASPSHIKVWDTDTGYHQYPTHEWMRKWGKMNYRSIIIQKKNS